MASARHLMSLFARLATERGVEHAQIIERSTTTSELPAAVTEQARTYDVA